MLLLLLLQLLLLLLLLRQPVRELARAQAQALALAALALAALALAALALVALALVAVELATPQYHTVLKTPNMQITMQVAESTKTPQTPEILLATRQARI